LRDHIDPENDKAGLEKSGFKPQDQSAQNSKKILSKGGEQVALEQIQLTTQEYEKNLSNL